MPAKKTAAKTTPAPAKRTRKPKAAATQQPDTTDQSDAMTQQQVGDTATLQLPLTSTAPTPALMDKLTEWYAALAEAEKAKAVIARELQLRREAFALAFPQAIEGTNAFPLSGGYVLKGVAKYDYKLDEAALPAVAQQLREHNVVTDSLIRARPELVLSVYRILSDDNKAILAQALTIKAQSPTLEIVPPKTANPA